MNSIKYKWLRVLLPVIIALGGIAGFGIRQARATHTGAAQTGIVCTTNPSDTFTITAKAGFISMTDGNTVYMWSFAEGIDDFQYPGPVLCVHQGDKVTIVLHNSLAEDVSLIFPGQENVLANGLPSQPQFSGGVLTSLAPVATATNGTMTYSFIAGEPGTYLYESGTNPSIQVQMGLYGALIVYPPAGPSGEEYAYNRLDTQYNPQTEYLLILSEIDPLLHQAIERGQTYNMSQYKARYYLINGRTFPDTIAPNLASWLPNQPYGALAHIHPYDAVNNPLPSLARYIGVGSEDYPFHPHAFNGRVIARDGRLLQGPSGEDLSYEKFSVMVGPGQTWDTLFSWEDTAGYNPDTNPLPVELPSDQNLTIGPFWGGSAYLGTSETLPVGTTSYNQCGEFYHIAHNHALQQLVGWGVVMTGQTTFTRVDPPLPNSCPPIQ